MVQQPPNPPQGGSSDKPPGGFTTLHEGLPLAAFYAAEMLRPLIGKTVWVRDAGGRVRTGELASVPRVREDQREEGLAPVEFVDERPLYLRRIVCIALYEGWEKARDNAHLRDKGH